MQFILRYQFLYKFNNNIFSQDLIIWTLWFSLKTEGKNSVNH